MDYRRRSSPLTRRYAIFLKGEIVDLCVPSEAAVTDGWSDWFNDAETTRHLGQGVFPNTPQQQLDFLKALPGGARLSLLICDKAGTELWGTISLSAIDWVARSAQIALVLPAGGQRPALAALEAMARMTEHAFETMGLERVWAGQSFPALAKWNQRLELLGYRTEGLLRRGVAKGRKISDSVMLSVLYADYRRLCDGGGYWRGEARMAAAVKLLPELSLAHRIADAIRREQDAYELEMKAADGA